MRVEESHGRIFGAPGIILRHWLAPFPLNRAGILFEADSAENFFIGDYFQRFVDTLRFLNDDDRAKRNECWKDFADASAIKTGFKDPPHNCAQPRHIIPADPNFEKKRNSSALFAREINLVTQPSFDCEQGINSQVQTVCSNADAVFPVLGIVFCKNERFSLSRKTHVPLWNEPRISHVRLL